MTTITHYTTYDLAYYYTGTKRLPRLSDEEQRKLISVLATATIQQLPLEQITRAQHRLIEGHLGLATHIAIQECPPRWYHSALPDLVQEANLALIQAMNHYDLSGGGDFTAYAGAWMHAKVKGAIANHHLIRISWSARERARQTGTLDELYAIQPISLDRLLGEHDPESDWEETLEAPPVQSTPPRDERKRAQVETLLSYLSVRAQTILRLRYGLGEEDERAYLPSEIAHMLGLSRSMVNLTIHDALQRLRALAAGQAKLVKRNGKLCISLLGSRAPTVSAERQAILTHAYTRLKIEGMSITARLLAEETGIPRNVVGVFLRHHCGEASTAAQRKEARRQARLHKLEEAYARLEAAGQTPSERALARTARVAKTTALDFLRTRRQQQRATEEGQAVRARGKGEACHV